MITKPTAIKLTALIVAGSLLALLGFLLYTGGADGGVFNEAKYSRVGGPPDRPVIRGNEVVFPYRPILRPNLFAGQEGVPSAASGGEVAFPGVEAVMEKGLALAGASPVHIAIRGNSVQDSTRCEWRGVARTAKQRDKAMRFWLGLSGSDPLPSPAEAERLFTAELERISAAYPETLKANFRDLAWGGLSSEYLFLTCYVDYTVSEYLLGGGTKELTVAYDRFAEERSYELYQRAHAMGELGSQELLSEGRYQEFLDGQADLGGRTLDALFEGKDTIVFLAPMAAHNAIAVEVWQAVAQWDVEVDDSGTKVAVRYGASLEDAEFSQPLSNLESRITIAGASDSFAGKRMTDTAQITQYYRDIGATATSPPPTIPP